MQYQEVLSTLEHSHICDFCHESHPYIIYENEYHFIVPARAPYVDDHLLIIPKRHVILLKDMTHPEIISLHELVDTWAIKLHKNHQAVNLLLRDGLVSEISGKSINHLHFHLIPDCPIGADDKSLSDREFFDNETYIMVTKKIKEQYL